MKSQELRIYQTTEMMRFRFVTLELELRLKEAVVNKVVGRNENGNPERELHHIVRLNSVFVNKSLEKKSIENCCDGTSTNRMSNDGSERKCTTRIALKWRTTSEDDPITVERTIGRTLKSKQHTDRLVKESSEMDKQITKIQEEKRDR
jgi:hypothetical protein